MATKIVNEFIPHPDKVFVTDIESGPNVTKSGIIIPDDNATNRGIRARWAQVCMIGKNVTDVKVGEWLFIEHGRWSFGLDLEQPNGDILRVWHVDHPNATMAAADFDPRVNQKTAL